MHQGGEVVNTMLKLSHATIGKSFLFPLTWKATFAFLSEHLNQLKRFLASVVTDHCCSKI